MSHPVVENTAAAFRWALRQGCPPVALVAISALSNEVSEDWLLQALQLAMPDVDQGAMHLEVLALIRTDFGGAG